MASLALTNARVFDGSDFQNKQTVLVEDGLIAAVGASSNADEQLDLDGDLIAPGFIDLQVNGGGGVLFNNEPTCEAIRQIGEAHRRFGTTGFLPTLISADIETTKKAIDASQRAISDKSPGVLGIHLEGPFLNQARRGAHNAAAVRKPERADIELLCQERLGKTLLTVAPEVVPDQAMQTLAEAGLIIFAGHTEATRDQIASALERGLRGFTHLFNAMSQITPREPGAVGAALEATEAWCGVIADGHHVHLANLRLTVAQKPGRVFLVTDAMPTVGTGDSTFRLDGRLVQRRGSRLTLDDGTLAGSCLDMATAVRNAVQMIGLPLSEALRMASAYPAAVIGFELSHGRIATGYQADLVRLDSDLNVVGTWIAGRYQAAGAHSG